MPDRTLEGFLGWWFRDRTTGKLVIAQFPNGTLGVWMAAAILHAIVGDVARAELLRWVGGGALLAWGVDELARGANPFRRVLGAVAVAYEVHAVVVGLRAT
jgi:hypothetical protein